ncbi:MAG TPA: hypothetical protein VF753_19610 [Terriglobales bacterium]
MTFDGANMWVANTYSNTVSKVSPAGVVLATFPSSHPNGIAFDGASVWVANDGAGTLSKF